MDHEDQCDQWCHPGDQHQQDLLISGRFGRAPTGPPGLMNPPWCRGAILAMNFDWCIEGNFKNVLVETQERNPRMHEDWRRQLQSNKGGL